MLLSVIIPTYNPNLQRLSLVLEALKKQTIAVDKWELIIIDNNSTNSTLQHISLSWKVNAKIIQENKQGLTYARLKGFSEAKGEFFILVDDDNLLDEAFLQNVWLIFTNHTDLGALGGKSLPKFESEEQLWLKNFYHSLALRDFGDQPIIETWQNKYPVHAPIGAGMALRKIALNSYINKITIGKSVITDRNGTSLSSGGDNDIILEVIKSGWTTGYFPELVLKHIIPAERLEVSYLARLAKALNKSWVIILANHGINPWPDIPKWTVPLRKLKGWIVYRAWKSEPNYINWKGACGTFEGLADMKNKKLL